MKFDKRGLIIIFYIQVDLKLTLYVLLFFSYLFAVLSRLHNVLDNKVN